eukprot:TRINITY_DN13658_c1_g1_i1.p1 TRINITY_DN13658_c1_g1~~TRINITY_DN13658_c1_g1_i1.p1  ORF type:complete len:762 (+),score=131.24 TRINITY_DN13658_c1_g1_i1:52-2286(+)
MEEDDDHCTKEDDGVAKKKKQRKKKKNKVAKEDDGDADHGPSAVMSGGGARKTLDCNPEAATKALDPFIDEWVDMSDVFTLATQGMKRGEMIESPQFRLFDAMSAIEIMDPKMDTGYNSTADMTLERAMGTGIIKQSLPHEELIGILDRLLMYYMLWLEGHTIAQTTFSCLYLQDLERCVKPLPLLGAFVDAFLSACRKARETILRANVFDDEDFLPNTFTFNLQLYVFSDNPTTISDRIRRECKALSKESSKIAAEVSLRLEFMGEYAAALLELQRNTSDAITASSKKYTEAVQRRLTTCSVLLEKMRVTSEPPGPNVLKCFDASSNRKLLVPGPPRTVVPLEDPKVAFTRWISHVNELLSCGCVVQKSLTQLVEGGTTDREEPNVLSRSVEQLCVSESGLLRRAMLDSLEHFLFPREALQHCEKRVEAFLDHGENLFFHMLKLSHANRARRFRRLAHVFADFNALQHEAWQLDDELKSTFATNLRHPRPCWMWVMEHCLHAMITKLSLGFELDLYDEAEHHMIYWYTDYLYGLRIYNLNELYHAREQQVTGSGGKRRPKPQPQKGGQRPRVAPLIVLFLEARQHAVRGLFRLLAFCLNRGFISSPACADDCLAQRFVLRFRSLEHFRLPHLPCFRDFHQSAVSCQAPFEGRLVLDAAQASFTEAGNLIERCLGSFGKDSSAVSQDGVSVESIKSLRKVVIANQLAVTKLTQGLSANKQMKVSAVPSHHPHLVSAQVETISAA